MHIYEKKKHEQTIGVRDAGDDDRVTLLTHLSVVTTVFCEQR